MTALVASKISHLLSPTTHSWHLISLSLVVMAASLNLRWTQRLFLFCARTLFACFYKIRVLGIENIPRQGGVLLVSNHISWFDGLILMALQPRKQRVVIHSGNFKNRWIRRWADSWDSILIDSGPKQIVKAIKQVREALAGGEAVLLFPEGGISRTGQIRTFRPGMMKMLQGTEAVIVPIYIDDLWGSFFSFAGGGFFRSWSRRWRYPVTITYGQPLRDVQNEKEVRQAVQLLGAQAVAHRQKKYMLPPLAAIRSCKRRLFRSKFADTSGSDSTGGNALLRSLILRRLLRKHVLGTEERRVGLLLPPSLGGVLANLALALDRRCAINLNYTLSSDLINHCIRAAGIKHVLTSRQVLNKLDLNLECEVVCLEDFRKKVTLLDKISGMIQMAMPTAALSMFLGLGRIRGDDVATIIFTSGSTGTPKGVELTFDNIASNIEAIDQVINLNSEDVVVGILPFFHSFGYTVTFWTPSALDIKSVYHYSPIDAKRVGELVQAHNATVFLATPTFLRTYLKRCTPEQFATLNVVVAGAEKLPVALCDAFEEKFGVRPVEGYGCTELSPLASVNVPPSRSYDTSQVERKEGTVGRPIPSVAAKVVDPDSGDALPVGETGMLMIRGPNVMRGYLDQPEKTAEVVKDGWYVTGDIARIDEDGFIQITGRESRFSKIGGEMVPHIQIEERMNELVQADEEEGLQLAVTAVPDPRKGECLVVLHRNIDMTPEQLRATLLADGLPPIFVPSEDDFHQVDELPVLGTGKLDLKGIKDMAMKIKGHNN